jgi:glycosyltransferase involved in cell wall biosynthesis
MTLKVIYCGQFTDASGYGSAARGYLNAIDKSDLNIELKVHNVAFEGSSKISKSNQQLISKYSFDSPDTIKDWINSRDYILVWHLPAPSFYVHLDRHKEVADLTDVLVRGAKRIVNLAAWEYSDIPLEWKKVWRELCVDATISPSRWNQEVFTKANENLNHYLIPHVIKDYSQQSQKPKNINEDLLKNKFTIFTMSQWGYRKGFDLLIKAYASEFKNQDDVALVMKTYGHYVGNVYPLEEKAQNEGILKEIGNIKNSVILEEYKKSTVPIYFIPSVLPFENISWLHENSSVFALSTRGEGFGLTIAEALMHEKPVVVPDQGGHIDYISPESAFFVQGHWTPSFGDLMHTSDTLWYEPNINSIRQQLRKAYEIWKKDPKQLEDMGKKGKKYILSHNYDYESIGKRFHNALLNENEYNTHNKIGDVRKLTSDAKWRLKKERDLTKKINLLKDTYKDKECVILACGPSLNDVDKDKLREFCNDKVVLAVKQAYDFLPEVVDFHFWNCSNLPSPSINGAHYPYWKKEPIVICSSNYDLGMRWDASKQNQDVFFKIPIRTEINNEFVTKTKKFDDYLLEKQLTRPCGPGIMLETVIYTAVHLGVNKITAIGWDINNAQTEKEHQHFFGDTDKLFNRGDVLDWEIEANQKASKDLFDWLKEKNIELVLASDKSSLYNGIPRVTL